MSSTVKYSVRPELVEGRVAQVRQAHHEGFFKIHTCQNKID
ncbi:hypothetical protein CRENPOLYSF1_1420006 [Crenothrix polyspora]|uniref:Uncharacterized protein n=1 Tax=Crenothrix polyspora TaxID=360316 RepID=A0A1R4H2B8_9GAMM|nr:hypothetical protein CRENPOLYSF1_1420006 [Crenothrix polyspora]